MEPRPVVCPNCDTPVPEADLPAGWCEACGKHLPAWLMNSLPYNRTHHTRTHGGPGSSQTIPVLPTMSGHTCSLCGETTMDTQPCYLCPTRPALGSNPSAARWTAVQCWACAACYDRGRELRLNQQIAAGWAAVSVLGGLLAVTGIALSGASWVLYPIVIVVAAMSVAACVLYLRYRPGRQTAAWLGRLDPALRSALRVPEWGYRTTVRVTQTLPPEATATDVGELTQQASPAPLPVSRPEPVARVAAGHPA
jgi:hypothetical protein